jgi:cell division septation protein DedD
MKKIIYIIILCFVVPNIFAQAPNSNWVKVLELEDQYVFVDTSNIKKIESQISALGLTVYKTAQLFSQIKKEAISVKTQFVFDSENKKYTVIGTLYYDKLWKIIGENSVPGASITNPLFSLFVDSSKSVSTIFSKCEEYLAKKNVEAKQKENSKTISSAKEIKKEKPEIKEVKKDTIVQNKQNREALTEKFIDKKIKEDSQPVFVDKPKSVQPKQSQPEKKSNGAEYNSTVEQNVKKTIYTDGSKYCFQISSWQNKVKAESEVAKLKNQGHNAFLTEIYLANRGGTWYRVRIGYFNSIEETENYMRKVR